jgi:hypothetical protein
MWKTYRKKSTQDPYVPGEDMGGISVSVNDVLEEGGMIARNPDDYSDMWYIAKDFFQKNYMEVRHG